MKEGDIISLEYEGWADGKLFDTTSEAVAREHDLHDDQRLYEPLVVVVGGGRLVAGLEEHLREAEVGRAYEVTIPAEKAYGQRDPRLIRMHAAAEFPGSSSRPTPARRSRSTAATATSAWWPARASASTTTTTWRART